MPFIGLLDAICSGSDDPACVAAAIAQGADLDERDAESGMSAVMFAAMMGKPKVIRALAKAGCEPCLSGSLPQPDLTYYI